MSEKVQVRFSIEVAGMIGGSFEMDREDYERIKDRLEPRMRSHEETELAEELLDHAPFDYMRHLNITGMEIEDLGIDEQEGRS